MPAALPAEVRMSPSSMYSTPGSTVTFGYRRASSAHSAQCVVARRPSSSPAAARRTRRCTATRSRLPRREPAAGPRESRPGIPGRGPAGAVGSTITVSALTIRSGPCAARIWNPASTVTGPGAIPQTELRYQGTPNTADQLPKTSQATPLERADPVTDDDGNGTGAARRRRAARGSGGPPGRAEAGRMVAHLVNPVTYRGPRRGARWPDDTSPAPRNRRRPGPGRRPRGEGHR